MTRFLQCSLIVFVALLLFYPPGKAAAGDDFGVRLVKDIFDQLWDYQNKPAEGKKNVGFDIPEMVVNQYIAYLIDSKTRVGVKAATIKITGKNQVIVDCKLDLAQIRKWNPAAIKSDDPLAGKDALPVTATASVDITNGMAKISILSAISMNGVSLDTIKALFRTVAMNQPEHFDIDKPIKLPFDLSVAMADGVVSGKTPQ